MRLSSSLNPLLSFNSNSQGSRIAVSAEDEGLVVLFALMGNRAGQNREKSSIVLVRSTIGGPYPKHGARSRFSGAMQIFLAHAAVVNIRLNHFLNNPFLRPDAS